LQGVKNIISIAFAGFGIATASVVCGAIPEMTVTVSDASGKAAYKGSTGTTGMFTTGTLKPGAYVVQFNAKSADVKGSNYALVVSAGTKKVVANAVEGEKFAAGGVAVRISVESGSSITGRVASDLQTMLKDGKKLVWIPQQLGSQLPGRWVLADSAEARQAQTVRSYSFKNIQDRQSGTHE
jgi:hypothetical protein